MEDFSNEEILEYQLTADKFSRRWVELYNEEGIKNYIHMMMSGHFSYFLDKCHNLYRYKQQGWEHLNKLIKCYFFHRTQRGGSYGQSTGMAGQQIVSIAKWVQRTILWRNGKIEKYFMSKSNICS